MQIVLPLAGSLMGVFIAFSLQRRATLPTRGPMPSNDSFFI